MLISYLVSITCPCTPRPYSIPFHSTSRLFIPHKFFNLAELMMMKMNDNKTNFKRGVKMGVRA